jgi:hypothetical protein
MIFLNLPAIFGFHEQLLARMQLLSKTSPWTMAEVFCNQADVMVELYGNYCTLHPKSLQALDRRMVSLVAWVKIVVPCGVCGVVFRFCFLLLEVHPRL